MSPRAALALALAAALAGCSNAAPAGVDTAALDEAIANSIGDPTTCVLVVKKATGDVVYRYGTHMTCSREMPSCEGAATTNVENVAKAASQGVAKSASCPTSAGAVGWTAGDLPTSKPQTFGDLAYAAAMNSKRALPGREMAVRLESAFAKGGF